MKIKTLNDIKKVSDKFFILETEMLNKGFKERSDAKKVIIPGFESIDAFAIVIKVASYTYYKITEASTGGLIFSATDKSYSLKEALHVASERIGRGGGAEPFNKRLVNAINNNGLSPRYKIEITEETKSLIAQENREANLGIIRQQNSEHKNLCELSDKLYEVLDLIQNQTFSLKGEDEVIKVVMKLEEHIDNVTTEIGKAIDYKIEKVKKIKEES